jgi:hypothetical protein
MPVACPLSRVPSNPLHFSHFYVWGPGLQTLTPNICHPPCFKLKDDPTMPPRTRISSRLSRPEDKANQPSTHNPPTQNLETITEGLRHEAFNDIPEVQLHHPISNTSTTTAGSSQNARGANSTQTNEGAPHQLPPRAPSPIQVIQGDVVLEQL